MHQRRYALENLKKFKMYHCNIDITHVEPRLQLSKNEHEQDVNPTQNRSLIGFLWYLCNTRPDLAFSVVEIVRKFMERPKVSPLAAIKRILRHVKCSIGYGILFSTTKKDRKGNLLGYTNSI